MSKVFTVIFEGNQPSITSTIGFDQQPAKIIAVYAGNRIEKLEAALNDMSQYVSRADWHYLKPETIAALEGKDAPQEPI